MDLKQQFNDEDFDDRKSLGELKEKAEKLMEKYKKNSNNQD